LTRTQVELGIAPARLVGPEAVRTGTATPRPPTPTWLVLGLLTVLRLVRLALVPRLVGPASVLRLVRLASVLRLVTPAVLMGPDPMALIGLTVKSTSLSKGAR
jgi:hypothetical protein